MCGGAATLVLLDPADLTRDWYGLSDTVLGVAADDPVPMAVSSPICFYDRPIPHVSAYTYLGIHFNANLDPNAMVKDRIQKAIIKASDLTPLFGSPNVSIYVKALAIKTIVMACATYGGDVFGMSIYHSQKIERSLNTISASVLASIATRAYSTNPSSARTSAFPTRHIDQPSHGRVSSSKPTRCTWSSHVSSGASRPSPTGLLFHFDGCGASRSSPRKERNGTPSA